MAEELSYILITPYTILKSRTGGVVARLLSRSDIELVAAQMIAPSKELAEKYAASLLETVGARDKRAAKLLSDYVKRTFSPSGGRRHRVMMLMFKGENTCSKLFSIAGDIFTDTRSDSSRITGETIRDTYADLVIDPGSDDVRYFEPAVLTPLSPEFAIPKLRMFAEFAAKESNLVENMKYDDPEGIERTLVIIKPDNWRFPSSKPGNIIDMFSRTGLRIIGCKVNRMTVRDALEFYGPVKNVLREKLAPKIGEKAKVLLEDEFNIKLEMSCLDCLVGSVGKAFADDQFSQIVEFMSGRRPDECSEEDLDTPGLVKSMVLVYEGRDAISKIRDVLGPTDPTKAPSGTIRKEFGQDVMVNTAHASDSTESFDRESGILKIERNNLADIIIDFLND
ncbi:MAG: nucleoside-diphosphate kinase [Kiritimatiellaeota bacterium]|nr:nucleoside-diphosphate kinase [Kiritimatiellota bacterium]